MPITKQMYRNNDTKPGVNVACSKPSWTEGMAGGDGETNASTNNNGVEAATEELAGEEEEKGSGVRFPLARIKRIMKADPELGLASQDAVFLVAKATVGFPYVGLVVLGEDQANIIEREFWFQLFLFLEFCRAWIARAETAALEGNALTRAASSDAAASAFRGSAKADTYSSCMLGS